MLFYSVISGFVLAALAPTLHRWLKGASAWLFALFAFGLAFYYLRLMPVVLGTEGGGVLEHLPWVPSLNIHFSFRLDGLSLLFVLLISIFGAFIFMYAGGYLKGDAHLGRFYSYLAMFMASMLGVVLADNLIVLFIFWELTSLSSYFLIGYKHQYDSARRAALQALLVTGLGGLALLLGFIVIGMEIGSFSLHEILTQGEVLRSSNSLVVIILLLLFGAFTKSAQWPFHFWLPNAMEAPTPVSAYLHSATMVKAGIYLLARFSPVFHDLPLWQTLLVSFGAITTLTAAILALKSFDLKKMLAYSTLLALGTLTLLLGLGSKEAFKAAMVFLLAHSLYKAALFMAAGAIDHEAGSRDIHKLGGLIRRMPVTFMVVLLAGISMAGLPPAFGFIGKELAYKSLVDNWLPLIALLLSNIGLFAVSFALIVRTFLGGLRSEHPEVHEAPFTMLLGPVVLAVACIGFGFWHSSLDGLLSAAASSLYGKDISFHLHLWPASVDTALILSIITVTLGAILFALWLPVHKGLRSLDASLDVGPARWYESALLRLAALARWATLTLQPGNLRKDLRIMFFFSFALILYTLLLRSDLNLHWNFDDIAVYDVFLLFLMVGGAISTARARTRLSAIISLGAVGLSVALVFVVFGAPDLSITQFMIETLVVIIISLVMVRLPAFKPNERSGRRNRMADVAIASLGGLAISLLMLAILSQPFNGNLNEFFEANSVPKGKGHNIVNVILVDFRAVDTMGEISVLAVAALGGFALLKLATRKDDEPDES